MFGQYVEYDGTRSSDLDSSGNMDDSMESTTSGKSAVADNIAPSKIGSSRKTADNIATSGSGTLMVGDGFASTGFSNTYVSIVHGCSKLELILYVCIFISR